MLWKQNRQKQVDKVRQKSPARSSALKKNTKQKSIHHHHHHHHHHHYHISSPALVDTGRFLPGSDENVINVGTVVDVHPADPSQQQRLMITDGRADVIDVADKNQLRFHVEPPPDSTVSLILSFTFRLPLPTSSLLSSVRSTRSLTSEKRSRLSSEKSEPGGGFIDQRGPFFVMSENRCSGKLSFAKSWFRLLKTCFFSDYVTHKCLSAPASPHRFGDYVTSNLNCSCSVYDVTRTDCFESEAEEVVVNEVTDPSKRCSNAVSCWQVSVGSAIELNQWFLIFLFFLFMYQTWLPDLPSIFRIIKR